MSRGAVPKVNRVRDVDGKRRMQEFRTIAADGNVHGPDLPPGDWPEATVRLYEALRRDAIGTTLTETEWLTVVDTMRLHALMWGDQPTAALKSSAEVRLRLQALGVSPEARMKLRLLVDDHSEPPSKLESFRERDAARRRRLMKGIQQERNA